MAEYQGHKNKTYWNVSLYLNNEYNLYRLLVEMAKEPGRAVTVARKMQALLPARTPDGFRYTIGAIAAAIIDEREAQDEAHNSGRC